MKSEYQDEVVVVVNSIELGQSKRKSLVAILGGTVLTAAAFPKDWVGPVIEGFLLPAHAQTSVNPKPKPTNPDNPPEPPEDPSYEIENCAFVALDSNGSTITVVGNTVSGLLVATGATIPTGLGVVVFTLTSIQSPGSSVTVGCEVLAGGIINGLGSSQNSFPGTITSVTGTLSFVDQATHGIETCELTLPFTDNA